MPTHQPPLTKTPSHYTYRPMTKEDIQSVAHIDQLAQPNPWQLQQFEQSLQGIRHGWVAVQNNSMKPPQEKQGNSCISSISGVAIFSLIAGEAELLTISIHPDHRRQGLAEGLIAQGINTLTPQQLFLEVRQSNLAAIQLYEKIGMNCIAERRGYYPANERLNKPREDALVYAMDFSSE